MNGYEGHKLGKLAEVRKRTGIWAGGSGRGDLVLEGAEAGAVEAQEALEPARRALLPRRRAGSGCGACLCGRGGTRAYREGACYRLLVHKIASINHYAPPLPSAHYP